MTHAPLGRLRVRLTLWYCGTFAVILALLGLGLYAAIHDQITGQLRRSLRESTDALVQAAHTREMEASAASGSVMDAVDELHIPGQRLYLLDGEARPVKPARAPDAILSAARQALAEGSAEGVIPHRANGEEQEEDERHFFARRFRLQSGAAMVAVASADVLELQERYSSLIVSFGIAALAALILVAGGGWFLVRQSTRPIERNIARMRQFMADAAHELRTPVTVVRSRAEIALQQPRETPSYVDTLQGIEAEGIRMGRLVDDLLILARADAGERPVERTRVFLDDIVLDAADAARVVARRADIAVEMEQYEETVVDGDPALLRQLAMILLDNAIKFTPRGGRIAIRVGREEGHPVLVVRDTGCGITADQVPHIFERFYRGDTARTSHPGDGATQGAGLGLSIARWICDAHRAEILVDSTPGVGTTMRVTFPRPKEG